MIYTDGWYEGKWQCRCGYLCDTSEEAHAHHNKTGPLEGRADMMRWNMNAHRDQIWPSESDAGDWVKFKDVHAEIEKARKEIRAELSAQYRERLGIAYAKHSAMIYELQVAAREGNLFQYVSSLSRHDSNPPNCCPCWKPDGSMEMAGPCTCKCHETRGARQRNFGSSPAVDAMPIIHAMQEVQRIFDKAIKELMP